MANRKCGKCTECCNALFITELEKPKHTRCPHLRGDKPGCGIYKKRPSECAAFQCVWTQREVPNSQKPDQVGMMAYYVDSQFGPTLLITETRKNAFENNPDAKEKLIQLAEKKKIAAIIATYSGDAVAMVP